MSSKEISLLLAALFACVLVAIPLLIALVNGATEEQCVQFKGSELIILSPERHTGAPDPYEFSCAWLANKLMYNGSGFEVIDVRPDDGNGWESWVLTRK